MNIYWKGMKNEEKHLLAGRSNTNMWQVSGQRSVITYCTYLMPIINVSLVRTRLLSLQRKKYGIFAAYFAEQMINFKRLMGYL